MNNNSDQPTGHPIQTPVIVPYTVLTKRELIAAMCLQGILANHAIALPGTNANNKTALAIVHADTLLSQLEKTKQHE